ncbi:glycosyltransferase [Pseudodonghicola xiamenensis]|uniref:Glycosyl transferase n=1 Tax=Pseudodonghicola xiamenensis TaxID=337702 RepID=A0A8J3HAK0_9RHOB|nr:glycosyltransferase [Pseudodonghicola xiamenensis]GHG95841.1 glycosyl transferase [Pseudodonghicola xiamenensis]
MNKQELNLPDSLAAAMPHLRRRPLGQFLVEMGVITQGHLVAALHLQRRFGVRLGDVLVAEGWATAKDICAALAQQSGIPQADLLRHAPDPVLARALPPQFWLRQGLLPWRRVGQVTMIATSDPDSFTRNLVLLRHSYGPVAPVIANRHQVQSAVAQNFAQELAEAANTRVPRDYSYRGWRPPCRRRLALIAACGFIALCLTAKALLALACVLAFLTLFLFVLLRLGGALANLLAHPMFHPLRPCPRALPWSSEWPCVSVMIPLYREPEIAEALLARIARLSYPKALLEVLLVLEEHDTITRQALAGSHLPPWMRIVEVPAHGGLTTKPRAMDYALDFCKGEIIGVWDAEDAPAEDQIERVVQRFAQAPARVACLQGILDFYNPRSNWRARCFTIEYATWFRLILPGLARLGLVMPLGGTTHFFRRAPLEALGGWDAHNVTEDADLGVRLYRAGYRTEMIDTITYEEATCRARPWIKQRSRWLKGFMVTYLVHMRQPITLWRDLGSWRFLGVQAFFLGTLGQFLLAPVLWSLWAMLLGLPHPLTPLLPPEVLRAGLALALVSETLSIVTGLAALARAGRRFLMPWVLTLPLYYPLGVLAVYKALYELLFDPFYWDKTLHGQAAPELPPQPPQDDVSDCVPACPHPVSAAS